MTKHDTNLGFSIVETLLILVVVGILGFTGWYIYHTKQVSNKDYAAAANTSTPTYKKKATTSTKSQTTSSTTTTSSQSQSGYLVISQWDVKVKMSDAADLTYSYSGQAGSSSNGTYDSSVTPVIEPSLLQNKSCKFAVTMFRTTQDMSTNPNAVKVGSYYYFEDGSPASCGDSTDNALANNLRQEFSVTNLAQSNS
jgi:hypothetical protein